MAIGSAPTRARADDAAAALEQALSRYERNGNRISAECAQTRLGKLQNAASR